MQKPPNLADEAKIEKLRRVVSLQASWETEKALRDWAKSAGFDLSWSYSGWPQHSSNFDFHVTVVASSNKVRIPDGMRMIDPLELKPSGYALLGKDSDTPVLAIDPSDTLAAIREFFIRAYGVEPTFADFRPHISLSYKWNGEPPIKDMAPPLPDFPLVFDTLAVAQLNDGVPSKSSDAASSAHRATFADKVTITGTRRTSDGYLVTEARVARGDNIQEYLGSEIGASEPHRVFKVWRPADEVFKADTLRTFAHRPITMGHPADGVTADNWRKEVVGMTGSEVIRDGEFVRIPMMIADAKAIAEIEAGVREVSMGYDCELVMQPGKTPDGRAYDAIQRAHRMNHAAIVEVGRAGPQCRIGDQLSRNQPVTNGDKPMKSVTIDGKTFDVADEVAAALAKAQADADAAVKVAKDAAETVDAAKDLLGKLQADKAASDKAADDAKASADAAAKKAADEKALGEVREAAKAIDAGVDLKDAATAADARKAVVAKVLGADAVAGKSDEYVSAAFDLLKGRAKDGDPIGDALRKGPDVVADAATKAFDAYGEHMQNAWKH